MQASQDFTANQTVSFQAYQCLRDALLQQSYLFESIVTEAQFALPFAQDETLAQRFVLMRSPALDVLFVATPITPDSSSDSTSVALPAYRVQLSFNPQAIDIFMDQLTSMADSANAQNRPINQDIRHHAMHPVAATAHSTSTQLPSASSSSSDPALTSQPAKPETASNSTKQPFPGEPINDAEPSSNEAAFALAWAKQLATSPDGAVQSTVSSQVQQSLLLNQVVTRIRHSLDLPSILETTVAQVRDFLSADRLVLYQFDQLEAVDLSSPSSTTPFSPWAEQAQVASKGTSPLSDPFRSDQKSTRNSNGVLGICSHEGHITYESRRSEDISSVLHVSEAVCFKPELSIKERYLAGQPVAIHDVEQHYAHADCLLQVLRKAAVKSKIIAPILVKGQLWGLLIAHQCDQPRQWQETEVMFLQQIAEHLAVAIEQSALYHKLQAQTESLESCVVERTQNLRDALLAAELANLTKGEFLSTMSHELRTPLTYIIGMSATLLRWSFGELSDRQRSYLQTINSSGEQLLNIINDILEFAKMSSGRTFLDVSEFSLEGLVREIVEHFQAIAGKQQVTLSLETHLNGNKFYADEKRLRQILSNLIHNAIKFTPAGGQITVRVKQENQTSIFQVEDTGIGIPESQKGMLFERFKQLESPFKRQYSGTGLGLAMTKRLVDLHGGTIQVKSTVGEGSTFSVRLPAQHPQKSDVRYQVPPISQRENKRILLLEVKENSAAIICDLLTADGYEVIWQAAVDQLIPQLESLNPAMLIADLSLLSHDANDIKKIQLCITAIGAKVLALLDQPVSQSSHIAHHDTLENPVDPKKLLEKVRQLMPTA